jgi:hypothetical protein
MSALLVTSAFAALLHTAPAQVEQFPVIVVEGTAHEPSAAPPNARARATEDTDEPFPVRTNFRARLLSSVHGL